MNNKQALPQPATAWSDTAVPTRPFENGVKGRLASFSIPAPHIDVGVFLQQAEGQPRVFWANGRDGRVQAGFGIAAQLLARGPDRFDDIHDQAAMLFREAHVYSAGNALSSPRLFGGFSFRDDFVPDYAWTAFQPAQFILPHFQLAQAGDESWLTINAILEPDQALSEMQDVLVEALNARVYSLRAAERAPLPASTASAALAVHYPLGYEAWRDQITQAATAITRSDLQKVVLARVCEVKSSRRLDSAGALTFLNGAYPQSTRFLIEPRPYHAFYGATPELLAQVDGTALRTMALAGSAPRGGTTVEDIALQAALLNSAKDRREHQLVVEMMQRRLASAVNELMLPDVPEVYTLSYIHHLLTPVTATLRAPTGVLPIVRLLHPTPALGGSPRDLALQFISDVEQVPRGWYAGPVGWLDHELNGEFAVAIRSAVTQDRRAWLYAGAGIVAGSEADKEWAETALKFEPMLRALGASPEMLEKGATPKT